MSDDLYFDGDPATDSARRHMERVLKEPESHHRRWPWVAASIAAAAAWYFWPRRGSADPDTRAEAQRPSSADAPRSAKAQSTSRA